MFVIFLFSFDVRFLHYIPHHHFEMCHVATFSSNFRGYFLHSKPYLIVMTFSESDPLLFQRGIDASSINI